MPFTLGGTIDENGKLSVHNQDALRRWINAHRDSIIELSVKVKKAKRSNPLNNYYRGVVVTRIRDRMNELGNDFDDDEVHDLLKTMFNGVEVKGLGDNYIELPRSTTRLDNMEFIGYLDRCRQFGAEMLGIYIEDPNEHLLIESNKTTNGKSKKLN